MMVRVQISRAGTTAEFTREENRAVNKAVDRRLRGKSTGIGNLSRAQRLRFRFLVSSAARRRLALAESARRGAALTEQREREAAGVGPATEFVTTIEPDVTRTKFAQAKVQDNKKLSFGQALRGAFVEGIRVGPKKDATTLGDIRGKAIEESITQQRAKFTGLSNEQLRTRAATDPRITTTDLGEGRQEFEFTPSIKQAKQAGKQAVRDVPLATRTQIFLQKDIPIATAQLGTGIIKKAPEFFPHQETITPEFETRLTGSFKERALLPLGIGVPKEQSSEIPLEKTPFIGKPIRILEETPVSPAAKIAVTTAAIAGGLALGGRTFVTTAKASGFKAATTETVRAFAPFKPSIRTSDIAPKIQSAQFKAQDIALKSRRYTPKTIVGKEIITKQGVTRIAGGSERIVTGLGKERIVTQTFISKGGQVTEFASGFRTVPSFELIPGVPITQAKTVATGAILGGKVTPLISGVEVSKVGRIGEEFIGKPIGDTPRITRTRPGFEFTGRGTAEGLKFPKIKAIGVSSKGTIGKTEITTFKIAPVTEKITSQSGLKAVEFFGGRTKTSGVILGKTTPSSATNILSKGSTKTALSKTFGKPVTTTPTQLTAQKITPATGFADPLVGKSLNIKTTKLGITKPVQQSFITTQSQIDSQKLDIIPASKVLTKQTTAPILEEKPITIGKVGQVPKFKLGQTPISSQTTIPRIAQPTITPTTTILTPAITTTTTILTPPTFRFKFTPAPAATPFLLGAAFPIGTLEGPRRRSRGRRGFKRRPTIEAAEFGITAPKPAELEFTGLVTRPIIKKKKKKKKKR